MCIDNFSQPLVDRAGSFMVSLVWKGVIPAVSKFNFSGIALKLADDPVCTTVLKQYKCLLTVIYGVLFVKVQHAVL